MRTSAVAVVPLEKWSVIGPEPSATAAPAPSRVASLDTEEGTGKVGAWEYATSRCEVWIVQVDELEVELEGGRAEWRALRRLERWIRIGGPLSGGGKRMGWASASEMGGEWVGGMGWCSEDQ